MYQKVTQIPQNFAVIWQKYANFFKNSFFKYAVIKFVPYSYQGTFP